MITVKMKWRNNINEQLTMNNEQLVEAFATEDCIKIVNTSNKFKQYNIVGLTVSV